MALAESILRRVHKLGLLPRLIALLPLLSALFAIASIGWMLVLPQNGQYRNTYISENALMPGQVNSYFRELEWNYVRGYRTQVANWDFLAKVARNDDLEAWLTDIGCKVGHHAVDNSSTMYAIMHAARGENTELMVVVVPYYTAEGRNVGALSLAPALARYFGRMLIWLKNIIFVFPKDYSVLRQWVEAYHTTLDLTAGSIEAALVMEYAGVHDNFDHLQVWYEGLNGQLPNLDLFNVVTTITRNEGIHVSIQDTPGEELTRNTYASRLRTLARGVLRLATAGLGPIRGCEAFSGWQIQAVTLKAVGTGGPDITQFGRIVDLTLRSVNNLLEKFHQLFFFYLLLAPTHFVSIGTYLPAAVLLAVAFATSSLCCLVNGVSLAAYIARIGDTLMAFTGIESLCLALAFALPKTEVSLTGAAVATVAVASLVLFRKPVLSPALSHLLVALALYFVAMLITALLIVHFALALCIGLCAYPLALVQPAIQKGKWVKARVFVCLLLSSPVTAIACMSYATGTELSGLLSAWRDLQCWTWFVVALGWLPAWLTIAVVCAAGSLA